MERISILPVITAILLFCTVFSGPSTAQDSTRVSRPLVAGVIPLPPFIMQDENKHWTGIAIKLLERASQELETTVEIREFATIANLKEALVNKEIDLIPCAEITEDFELLADFSIPYYRSGTALAAKIVHDRLTWNRIGSVLLSLYSHEVFGTLIFSWLFAGTLVWLFERKSNRKMFERQPTKGIGSGVWWAAVTMTTVGYGDKAPKTTGGRIVAVIWMFCSIVMISGLTGMVASFMAVDNMEGKLGSYQALLDSRVGALDNTYTITYLQENGVNVQPFNNVREGLESVSNDSIDAFATDEGVLQYLILKEYPKRLYVLDQKVDYLFVGMAVPPQSDLLEPLNRALLEVMATEEWKKILRRYVSS